MKKLETTKDKFEAITQRYMGMQPGDMKCGSWGEMQRQMAAELLEALEDRPEEMYYIQNGYVGNAMLWWGKDHSGYTSHFNRAGRYTKDEAIKIINNRPNDDCAWLCSHVDGNKAAQVMVVEIGNLDRDFRLTGKREE